MQPDADVPECTPLHTAVGCMNVGYDCVRTTQVGAHLGLDCCPKHLIIIAYIPDRPLEYSRIFSFFPEQSSIYFAGHMLHAETYLCVVSRVIRHHALFCVSASHKYVMDGLIMPPRAHNNKYISVCSSSKPSA
eukprot:6198342-Pleurochrysis_carterae.AAC.2